MLGAYAFPRAFDWAILVEKRQRDAYLAIDRMIDSLFAGSSPGWRSPGWARWRWPSGSAARSSRWTASRARSRKGNFQARVTGCALA